MLSLKYPPSLFSMSLHKLERKDHYQLNEKLNTTTVYFWGISSKFVVRLDRGINWFGFLTLRVFLFFGFFCSTRVWTQVLHLEPLHQPFFVMSFFQDRVSLTICWAGFEPWSSWSLPPEYLGLQVWATGAWLFCFVFNVFITNIFRDKKRMYQEQGRECMNFIWYLVFILKK
jgi:hypothetical protein